MTRNGQIVQLGKRATGEIILARLRWCSSFRCRLRGLTLRGPLQPGEGLVLDEGQESRLSTSIHMFFVFFPISVLWLDSHGRVVDTRLARPWQPAHVPQAPARYIVEADPALLDKIVIGDELDFIS